jgi:hypothetical protein
MVNPSNDRFETSLESGLLRTTAPDILAASATCLDPLQAWPEFLEKPPPGYLSAALTGFSEMAYVKPIDLHSLAARGSSWLVAQNLSSTTENPLNSST